jgi:hypothetical protein
MPSTMVSIIAHCNPAGGVGLLPDIIAVALFGLNTPNPSLFWINMLNCWCGYWSLRFRNFYTLEVLKHPVVAFSIG